MNAIINNDVTAEEATEAGRDFEILEVDMRSTSNQPDWLVPAKVVDKDVVLKIDTFAQANLWPLS